LLTSLAKTGWEVYAHQDYESRVRGGSNFFQVRVADYPLSSFSAKVDLLVAMTGESFHQFSTDLVPGSWAIHPGPLFNKGDYNEHVLDFEAVATEVGGSKKMANSVVAGFVWAYFADDMAAIEAELADFFTYLGEELVAANLIAARKGFELARSLGSKAMQLKAPRKSKARMLLRGNDAVALGSIAAGMKYISSYPMTPSTSIVEYIAAVAEEMELGVEQAEDEIAAVNMAIGAGYAGVRAMTTTSGGGYCLMSEAIGLAGSAEIPVVIVNGQRPGPSTGLPTRTEQGDLLFATFAGHGDFPRAVLAPGDVEDCFYIMGHAFNMAEEYQIPVTVLTDQYLGDSFQTIPSLDISNIQITRGAVAQPNPNYKRYALTESGISPRVYPGTEPAVVVCAGDEHDEEGHLIEDAPTRVAMMEKRMKKLELLRAKALPPQSEGSDEPGLTLITWGSVRGIARQALQAVNFNIRLVHLPQLWPLPVDKIKDLLVPVGKVWTVENNYSGQLAALLRMHGIDVQGAITRYDGRPITPEEIAKQVMEVLQ